MRIVRLIAAAGLAFAGIAGATTPAVAAPVTSASTLVVSAGASVSIQDRRYYRDDRRRWDRRRGYDRGRHYNRGRYHRSRRVCWTEWRRYQGRVTVCRRRR